MLTYMSWTVYRHITPSGKSYIGITSQKPEKRWSNGIGYDKDTPFGKAIEKYKWENIKHEILDTNIDEFEAKCLEEYYIFSFRTFVCFSDCNGYNCTLGGDGQVGREPWNKGQTGVQVAWNKGKHQTEETKEKISESKKGQIPVNKGKTGLQVAWNKGKTGVQVSWNKGKTGLQVAWNKGIPQTEESRRKNSEAHKGKHWKLIDGKRVYYE